MATVAPPTHAPRTPPGQPQRWLARFLDWLDPWTWPLAVLLMPVLLRFLPVPFLKDSATWAYQCGRIAGYLGAFFLLLPYLYYLRRKLLNWRLRSAQGWITWHILFAFLAFGTVLVHIDFRLSKPFGALTTWIFWLFVAVMVSGVLGLLGQKVLFRLLDDLVPAEFGREGLEQERQRLANASRRLVESWSLVTPNDVRDWDAFLNVVAAHPRISGLKGLNEPARRTSLLIRARRHAAEDLQDYLDALNEFLQTDTQFCREANLVGFVDTVRKERITKGTPEQIERWQRWLALAESLGSAADPQSRRHRLYLEYLCGDCLQECAAPPDFVVRFYREAIVPELAAPFTFWRWLLGGRRRSPLAENYYRRVQSIAPATAQGMVEQLWLWVLRRRALDREYRLHRIARLWVGVHALAAWALFVLVADHIVASVRYGGL